ncbi:MAG: hypothetical protein V4669_13535 [Pseudomonadota bacterium]
MYYEPALMLATIVIYLMGACACRLIAFSNEPPQWWMGAVCMVWPLVGILWLMYATGAWIVMGGRR